MMQNRVSYEVSNVNLLALRLSLPEANLNDRKSPLVPPLYAVAMIRGRTRRHHYDCAFFCGYTYVAWVNSRNLRVTCLITSVCRSSPFFLTDETRNPIDVGRVVRAYKFRKL
jgi:hypothetical protein